jgi:hypothetical protein
VILEQLDVDPDRFEVETGWAIKPEGACKGDTCVPLPDRDDVNDIARRLGMAWVHDDETGLNALGPESLSGHALLSAEAPELALADIEGNEFRLSSLRGQKVLLVAWAPY